MKHIADESRTRPIPLRVSVSLASGTLLQPVNSSMIAVAIVGVAAHFGSPTGVSWVISAMYIATAVGAPTAGRLGAIFGARRIYNVGLALVATGSLVGMFAPNIWWLVCAYALIGAGIATHMPNAMTMVRDYADRYRVQSRTAVTTLVVCGQSVAALGPTVGGLLVGSFGWQSILWVNLPVIALSAVAVNLIDVGDKERADAESSHRLADLDLPGIALFVLAMTSTMLFLASLRESPNWWMAAMSVAAIAVFVAHEWQAPTPFLDIRAMLANRPLSAAIGRALATQTCFYCIFFGIPQWLQYSRGMSAIEAGLTMLPVAGVSVVSTMVGSYTYRRFGARWTLAMGTGALSIGGILIACVERTTTPVVVLLMVAAVLGIPNGFNNIGNQHLINGVTTADTVGAAIGMYRTAQFIGANLAIVVLQLLAGTTIDDAGLHRVGWFIAIVAALLLAGIIVARRTLPAKLVFPIRSDTIDKSAGTPAPPIG